MYIDSKREKTKIAIVILENEQFHSTNNYYTFVNTKIIFADCNMHDNDKRFYLSKALLQSVN